MWCETGFDPKMLCGQKLTVVRNIVESKNELPYQDRKFEIQNL